MKHKQVFCKACKKEIPYQKGKVRRKYHSECKYWGRELWLEKNRGQRLKWQNQYYRAHKETILKKLAEFYKLNKKRILADRAEYYKNYKFWILARRKEKKRRGI